MVSVMLQKSEMVEVGLDQQPMRPDQVRISSVDGDF